MGFKPISPNVTLPSRRLSFYLVRTAVRRASRGVSPRFFIAAHHSFLEMTKKKKKKLQSLAFFYVGSRVPITRVLRFFFFFFSLLISHYRFEPI